MSLLVARRSLLLPRYQPLNLAAQFVAASNQYLSVADNATISIGDVDATIAGWFYFDSVVTAGLVGKWAAGDLEYLLYSFAAPARFRLIVRNADNLGNSEVIANTFGAFTSGVWYFVKATHEATANRITVSVNDGAADATATTAGVRDGTSALTLGAQDAVPNAPHDGRIDGVGIWKKLLTAAETTWLYNAGKGRRYRTLTSGTNGADLKTSLQAWWEHEEQSGTHYDAHGTNHMTNTNGVTAAIGVR